MSYVGRAGNDPVASAEMFLDPMVELMAAQMRAGSQSRGLAQTERRMANESRWQAQDEAIEQDRHAAVARAVAGIAEGAVQAVQGAITCGSADSRAAAADAGRARDLAQRDAQQVLERTPGATDRASLSAGARASVDRATDRASVASRQAGRYEAASQRASGQGQMLGALAPAMRSAGELMASGHAAEAARLRASADRAQESAEGAREQMQQANESGSRAMGRMEEILRGQSQRAEQLVARIPV